MSQPSACPTVSDFHAVICGGGVAAVEALLRLRRLAGDSVDITLLAPNDEFVYRALAVLEAAGLEPAHRYPLWDVAEEAGANWVKDTLAWIDPEARSAHTTKDAELRFDALLVAVGGRQIADLDHVVTFRDAEAGQVYDEVTRDVEAGAAKSIAFVLPEGPVYPLPLYEIALMAASHAHRAGIEGLELHVVTPEPAPLAVFGGTAGAVVAGLLTQAGVALHASACAYVPAPGRLLVQPEGIELNLDRIVAMPRVSGPGIRGLAGGGAHGYIPIDRYCVVPGTAGRIFAAGDATAFPIKHGGLSAQQADVAAAGIAHLAGASQEPAPLSAEIKGKLLTGGKPLYLSARVVGGQGFDSEVSETPAWAPDQKIVTQELGPYLSERDSETGGRP